MEKPEKASKGVASDLDQKGSTSWPGEELIIVTTLI